MKINFKNFLVFNIIVFIFCFGFVNLVNGADGETSPISGYAWNATNTSSGMGWLSFGGTSPSYGVEIDDLGNITGYAWSSNLGWLRFGGLSSFPTGGGTQEQNANLNGTQIQGWARFCSVLASVDCTGTTMKSSSSTGGWDGWVSLSGAGYGVNVDQSTGIFSGYAWGGPDVVGWIDFSQVLTDGNGQASLFLKANNDTGYIVIQIGSQATISATGSMLNTTGGIASGAWSGSKTCPSTLIPPGTSYSSFTHNTLGTFTYTLKCSKADGSGDITSSVDVVVIPENQDPNLCLTDPKPAYCIPTTRKPIYIEN